MSKLDEKVAAYTAEAKKLKLELSETLIEKITRSAGPSISQTISSQRFPLGLSGVRCLDRIC